jgi:tRNA-splicing ligase RtcB (3'-phosphate/5'-hydroxy nucleic acid ligase)
MEYTKKTQLTFFGSSGFAHNTASGFLNLANDRASGGNMEQVTALIVLDSDFGDV